jgi:hypothetical protein
MAAFQPGSPSLWHRPGAVNASELSLGYRAIEMLRIILLKVRTMNEITYYR